MLWPDEIVLYYSAAASLFCAVTLVRCAPVDAIQNNAKRDSFSRRFCSTAAIPHTCGVGWSKQLQIVKARLVTGRIMRGARKDHILQ